MQRNRDEILSLYLPIDEPDPSSTLSILFDGVVFGYITQAVLGLSELSIEIFQRPLITSPVPLSTANVRHNIEILCHALRVDFDKIGLFFRRPKLCLLCVFYWHFYSKILVSPRFSIVSKTTFVVFSCFGLQHDGLVCHVQSLPQLSMVRIQVQLSQYLQRFLVRYFTVS